MLRVDAPGERLPPGSQSCDLWRGRLGHASENGITCNFSAPDASKQDDRLRLGSARRESCDSDRDRAGNRRLAAMRPYMHPDTFSATTQAGELEADFISDDPDRFTLWLIAPQLAGQAPFGQVLLSSLPTVRDCSTTTTRPPCWHGNCPPYTGSFATFSQILVSDAVDDAGPGQWAKWGFPHSAYLGEDDVDQVLGDNPFLADRTHKISLGGTVYARWKYLDYVFETTASVPVEKVVANMRVKILNSGKGPVTTPGVVYEDIRRANERFAQIGLYIDPNTTAVTTLNVAENVGNVITADERGIATIQFKTLIKLIGTPAADDIDVGYVGKLNTGRTLGVATLGDHFSMLHYAASGINNSLIAAAREGTNYEFVLAHELLHIILQADEGDREHLVRYGFLGKAFYRDVTKQRRLGSQDGETALGSAFVAPAP